MCDECTRLQANYREASVRLMVAQHELARYRDAKDEDARLWKDCLSELRALWRLREEMAIHAASHSEGAMCANG
jgi:hypothetical protein